MDVRIPTFDIGDSWSTKYLFFLFVFEQTGETEDETEEKRVRKKREKKRGTGPLAALATEPAPQPESLVRGQRKNAASFFQELREELQGAPAVTPSGSPAGPAGAAAACSPPRNDREPVEVVQFHSRSKKRKQKPDQDENTKVMNRLMCENPDVVLPQF